jgi:hypothetical protein
MTDDKVPANAFDAPEADLEEQRRPLAGDAQQPQDRSSLDPEEPDLTPAELPEQLPGDADPADAYEQNRAIDYDEDEYR